VDDLSDRLNNEIGFVEVDVMPAARRRDLPTIGGQRRQVGLTAIMLCLLDRRARLCLIFELTLARAQHDHRNRPERMGLPATRRTYGDEIVSNVRPVTTRESRWE
jgi:hypothetical protein